MFGGRARVALGIAYRLTRGGRVTVRVLHGKGTVRTFGTATRRAGRTYRLRLAARGLTRGDYRVRLTVTRAGAKPITATLVSRRL